FFHNLLITQSSSDQHRQHSLQARYAVCGNLKLYIFEFYLMSCMLRNDGINHAFFEPFEQCFDILRSAKWWTDFVIRIKTLQLFVRNNRIMCRHIGINTESVSLGLLDKFYASFSGYTGEMYCCIVVFGQTQNS